MFTILGYIFYLKAMNFDDTPITLIAGSVVDFCLIILWVLSRAG